MKKLASYCILVPFFISACGILPLGSFSEDASDATEEVAQAIEDANTDNTASEGSTESELEESPTATAVPEEEPENTQTTDTPETETALASCNVDPLGLPQNSDIAGLLDSDWMKGDVAKDSITIIEYGDFQ